MADHNQDEGDDLGEVFPSLPWPNANHSLAKPDPNWTLNSCLGWSKDRPTSRIMGYREAADLIFRSLSEDRGGRDTLVYPLVFMWRHAIELQLKNIVERGQIVLGEPATYPKHHGLEETWKMAIKVIGALQEEDQGEIENVTNVIEELCALDPDSTGFRYHEKKNGQPTLHGAPELLPLGSIHEALAGVSSYLDCVDTCLEQAIDYITDASRA
jgi:hypothetical protein